MSPLIASCKRRQISKQQAAGAGLRRASSRRWGEMPAGPVPQQIQIQIQNQVVTDSGRDKTHRRRRRRWMLAARTRQPPSFVRRSVMPADGCAALISRNRVPRCSRRRNSGQLKSIGARWPQVAGPKSLARTLTGKPKNHDPLGRRQRRMHTSGREGDEGKADRGESARARPIPARISLTCFSSKEI